MSFSNANKKLGLSKWLRKEVIQKKFVSPWGIAFLALIGAGAGYFAANDLFVIPFAIGGGLIGVTIAYFCLFKPLTGYYIVTTLSFLAFYPNHLLGQDLLPLSTGVELLILVVFLGTFLSSKGSIEKKGSLLKTPISIALIFNTLYLLIEAFNPNIPSLVGWTPSLKRFLAFILIYVVSYKLINTPAKLRYFIKFWIVFTFAAALYGCLQQWFGFLPMEMKYIMSTPGVYELLFQGGQLRKFSFLSDVVSFGVLSGSMAALCLILGVYEKERRRKYILFFFAMIMTLGMAYSGTRTTTIMIPSALLLYGFMTIQNKTTIITLFVMVLVAAFIFFAPINNPTLVRVRSTFDSKEESLNLRDRNRHYIQPYIYSHPMGGGISTTGVEGVNFYPGHPLAGFPPDSGFLKVALEMGWMGLMIYFFLNMVILYQGIYYYFRMKNEEFKKLMIIILASLFPTILTQYSQISIGQIPGGIYFFATMALIKRLMEFDQQRSKEI